MKTLPLSSLWTLFAVSLLTNAAAEDLDILVQSLNSKLVVGTVDVDTETGALGARVFARSFDSLYSLDEPGFNSIGSASGTPPGGSSALPSGTDLGWDFLPMKVGGLLSNLLYWDGASPTEVSFGPPTGPNYSLSLFGQGDARAAADGSTMLVPGHVIDTTAPDGFIHKHRFFFLDNDHDDSNATQAAEGVYLVSLRLRMDGLDRSDPFLLLFGTPGASSAALDAAEAWVNERAAQLAASFDADFDGDLDVDGADLLTWQRHVGPGSALQIDGDADQNHTVGSADLTLWRTQFSSSPVTMPGAQAALTMAAPEPGSAAIALIAVVVGVCCCRASHRAALGIQRAV